MTIKTSEFLRAAAYIKVRTKALSTKLSLEYVNCILNKFPEASLKNHPQIYNAPISLETDAHEYTLSLTLNNKNAYIIFPQGGETKEKVVIVSNARKISEIFSECYGMEYAISDRLGSYLICVNWYSIDITGSITSIFHKK